MPQPDEDTLEGRLADLIEARELHWDDLSEYERGLIVKALRDRARWMAADIDADRQPKRKR